MTPMEIVSGHVRRDKEALKSQDLFLKYMTRWKDVGRMAQAKSSSKAEAIKLSIPALKKALKAYDQETLISILVDCYKQNQEVKNYIHVLLSPEEAIEELYLKAKHQILVEFFPERGSTKMRLSVAKKAISDFKKMSNDELRTIDLMIYYVEVGVDFTRTYGDIDEPFYSSMISMFDGVCSKVGAKEGLRNKFNRRLEKIVKNAQGTGWGFYEDLSIIYHELFAEDEED